MEKKLMDLAEKGDSEEIYALLHALKGGVRRYRGGAAVKGL